MSIDNVKGFIEALKAISSCRRHSARRVTRGNWDDSSPS